MGSVVSVDDDTKSEFVVGFFATAAVLGIFGAGLELGAVSAGEPLQLPLLAAMVFGAIASAGGVAKYRGE